MAPCKVESQELSMRLMDRHMEINLPDDYGSHPISLMDAAQDRLEELHLEALVRQVHIELFKI